MIRRGLIISATLLLLAGCMTKAPTPSQSTIPTMDMSKKSDAFKKGAKDGCNTAHGNYSKDSKLFKSNKDYHDGWFAGRSFCQQHQDADLNQSVTKLSTDTKK